MAHPLSNTITITARLVRENPLKLFKGLSYGTFFDLLSCSQKVLQISYDLTPRHSWYDARNLACLFQASTAEINLLIGLPVVLTWAECGFP